MKPCHTWEAQRQIHLITDHTTGFLKSSHMILENRKVLQVTNSWNMTLLFLSKFLNSLFLVVFINLFSFFFSVISSSLKTYTKAMHSTYRYRWGGMSISPFCSFKHIFLFYTTVKYSFQSLYIFMYLLYCFALSFYSKVQIYFAFSWCENIFLLLLNNLNHDGICFLDSSWKWAI